jgi:hypothetical protein
MLKLMLEERDKARDQDHDQGLDDMKDGISVLGLDHWGPFKLPVDRSNHRRSHIPSILHYWSSSVVVLVMLLKNEL